LKLKVESKKREDGKIKPMSNKKQAILSQQMLRLPIRKLEPQDIRLLQMVQRGGAKNGIKSEKRAPAAVLMYYIFAPQIS